MCGPGLFTPGGLVGNGVHDLVAVAIFIVILGSEVNKIVESNDSPSIKGRKVGITVKVSGDNLVLSIVLDAL